MSRKMSPMLIIILALVVIGLVSQSFTSPIQLIIPIAVFGVIFLLYKFPPGGARTAKPRSRTIPRRDQQQGKPRTKKAMPFRVIEGGKDDDNLPKYH
ncbi:hypothetical protein ACFOLF_05950 [Paenibacillus sepulcri]|uniref:PRA1 family protein n=1 Tax=Paenibacillus sepulcri TaxID=359917 RepID=A0ABS7BYU7_9BACL|nr:PRA1 family protein [Paenibacillus sepulcri]